MVNLHSPWCWTTGSCPSFLMTNNGCGSLASLGSVWPWDSPEPLAGEGQQGHLKAHCLTTDSRWLHQWEHTCLGVKKRRTVTIWSLWSVGVSSLVERSFRGGWELWPGVPTCPAWLVESHRPQEAKGYGRPHLYRCVLCSSY